MLFSSETYMDNEMIKEASRVLREEFFVGGKSVELFEQEFAEYIGTKYAIAVASGTDALVISLRCLNIKNTVITTPVSFVATSESIVLVGGKPKFVDIDYDIWNIDSKKIRNAIDEDTEAIMPVHLYGQPCNMDEIMEIAEDNHLYVIEDSAQAHGAVFNGKKTGTFGEANAFSFYSTKNMTVGGNGGMITTNDKKIAEMSKLLREHGGPTDDCKYVGYNARMNTVNAAIGRMQLKHLDEWNEKRRKLAELYYKELKDIDQIKLPYHDKNCVYHLFVIEAEKRDELRSHLKTKAIFCGIHYPTPVYRFEPYARYIDRTLQHAEHHTLTNISLPMYPALKEDDVKMVCDNIKDFYGGDKQ